MLTVLLCLLIIFVALLYVYMFSVFSNKMFWNVWNVFICVFGRGISMPSYKVFCIVSFLIISYNIIVCIIVTGTAVGARPVYMCCISAFIVWST